MKPSHELDDEKVVAKRLNPREAEGYHRQCPLGPPARLTGQGGTREDQITSSLDHPHM